MPDFLKEADLISDKIIAIRRDIHAHPEMGRNEVRTGALVAGLLSELDMEVRRCADTGVCATLTGKYPGPTVALRADMDALPIFEKTGLGYSSVCEGIMHACGHDIHTAALLGAAMLLNAHKDELHGSVRFLFQPDEEGDGGAQRMIDDGALDGVSCIFGAHVAPELMCGTVGVRYGNAYAASNPFDIALRGRSSHGAEPQLGADAIIAASHIVTSLQSVISRNTSPLDSAVLSIGSFHAGTARNIVADEAKLSGIVRCFGSEMRCSITERVRETVESISAALNVECEISFTWGYSGIINHAHETLTAQNALTDLLGKDSVIVESVPSMTTEDFGAFLEVVPGSYWHIGVGRGNETDHPLHNPHFSPDERSVALAAAAHARIVWEVLGK